ncbi:adhesion G-protein coupled receptor G4 [Sorex fumeus]|uniref:adhesion G-protein coupled receptor G4 n=1 Tax=Sorex fumeus TaxID=62283 RepID=UPI0024AE8146|nr:adhesion G-protein coupled receptor G4 [Sorex fumeus]
MDNSEIGSWQVDNALSLQGKRLDFYGRADTYVTLTKTVPELCRFTACIDLVFMNDTPTDWMAFYYIINSTFPGQETIDLGLAGDHKKLILYNLGRVFYIHYHLTPLRWHRLCLMWNGVKGRLELFLNKKRILVMMDQPQKLTSNGTLVLGHFLKNKDSLIKMTMRTYTSSLYYFQLWDHILDSEDLMKCMGGNIVSWEEDVWLVNKIVPTVDMKLRCCIFVFGTDYITLSYLNTASPLLEETTAPTSLKTPTTETAIFTADSLSASAVITLPAKSTLKGSTTNSMKITKSPSSVVTRTTKMTEIIDTETFYPTTTTNFLHTTGYAKNSFAPKPSVTRPQSILIKTTPLFSYIESNSMSTTPWHKQKSTDMRTLPISTAGQEFMASTATETKPWSTVGKISAISTHTGTASTLPPESVPSSAETPVSTVFPRDHTASILATSDSEIAVTVHSVTHPTRTIDMTSQLRTAETESTSVNFQKVSSPEVEDIKSTFVPKETSTTSPSFGKSSPFTKAQSAQTVTNVETTHTTLTPGVTLTPTMVETMLLPTTNGPAYTHNTSQGSDNMLPLLSTRSVYTSMTSEFGSKSINSKEPHQFSTNAATWTSKPDQTLLTSAFHGSTSNIEHSSTVTNIIILPEAATKGVSTTTTDTIVTADVTTDRYTTLSKLLSPWFANFSTVSETTSITKLPGCKLNTTIVKTTPLSTLARNELSTSRGTVIPPIDRVSTLTNVELNFSSTESASETTQTKINGTIAFRETSVPIPGSETTRRFETTVTRKETTTSHHPNETSTMATTAENSPFTAMMEATADESVQIVTVSVTVSPFPDIEKLSTLLNNKTAMTEVRESWLSTKSVKTTHNSSHSRTEEIINSPQTSTTFWVSGSVPDENSIPSITSGNKHTFSESFGDSTTKIFGTSFATTPTDRTVISSAVGVLPPQPTAHHSSATPVPITHMSSLSANVSSVTSLRVSEVTMPEYSTLARADSTSLPSYVSMATVTATSVPPLAQTVSTTSKTPTHRDSSPTISEAKVISVRMTPTAIPSHTEIPISSVTVRPVTPIAFKPGTTLPSSSVDRVTPYTHTLTCSKSPTDISVVSVTHVTSTMSMPKSSQPTSQMEETSTHAFSSPYTLSGAGDVGLVIDTTETSIVDNIMPSHTSANKFTASVGGHTSQFSISPVSTPVPTILVTSTSTLSSDKEQMTTILGNTPRTMKVTEITTSKNPFISDSQSTSPLEITDTGFYKTTKIPSHQTQLPSESPLVTLLEQISASSTLGSTKTIPSSTSSNTVDIYSSEAASSLGETVLSSQVPVTSTTLSPEKGSMSVLSGYTQSIDKMIASFTSVTSSVSYSEDSSFKDTTTSGTTIISNPVSSNTSLSHFLSPITQPDVTSIASPISENTQTSSEFLSYSTTGLFSGNFTVISTGKTTMTHPTQNVPTVFLGNTSMTTSIPIYQMSSLPVNVAAFTTKRVSDTSPTLMTKSSKTTHPDCLKSFSTAASRSMSEMSPMSVNDSAFSPPAVSSDSSTTVGLFSNLLSSITSRSTMTINPSTLDVIPMASAGPTSKSTMISSVFTTSEMAEVSSRITDTSFSSPTESMFPSPTDVPAISMTGIVTPFSSIMDSPQFSSKTTEVIPSVPNNTFLPLLSTTKQLSQGDKATIMGMLSGITNSSQSTVPRNRGTVLTNPCSRTTTPETVLSSTSSDDLHTSTNTQVYPFFTTFKSTHGPTKGVKTTSYFSSNTEKMTLSEKNTKAEFTKRVTSISYPPQAPSSTAPVSLTSFHFLPNSTETELSSTKTSLPPTSQMAEFPDLGARTTSRNTQSLIMTSWNAPTSKDSQFPISTSTHEPTLSKMETENPFFVPGFLSTHSTSQIVTEDIGMSSISTSEIFPTLGMPENPSISSRSTPTTLPNIKHTFEKTTTTLMPGITLSSESIISKPTASPMLTWILSSFPSDSPLVSISNTPHITSSTLEVSKPTFLTSNMRPTHQFTKFTLQPFDSASTIFTKTTPTPIVGTIPTSFLASIPTSVKTTDNSIHTSKSPEASFRTTRTVNSQTISQPPPITQMSRSPLTPDHTLSVGHKPLTSATITSAWSSRIPAASASSTSVLPNPAQDSFPNITTTTSNITGVSFPFTATGATHLSTAVSSLLSSSFETTWLDSTSSFPSTEASTSLIPEEFEVSFYNIEMSFSIFDEKPGIIITSVAKEYAENWLNSVFRGSEFALANLAVELKSRDSSEEEINTDRTFLEQRDGQEMMTIPHVSYSCVWQVIIKANSYLPSTKLIPRIKGKIKNNLKQGNFTSHKLKLSVTSEHILVEKLEPGKCKADKTASKYKGTYKWLLTNPTETAQTRCIKNEDANATRICSISIKTGKSRWEKPKFKQCRLLQGLPDRIVDLANITISDENADDVAEHILNLIKESPILDEEETKIIVSKVSDISHCNEISMNLTQMILQIINAALEKQNNSASDLHEVSNEILRIIERVGHKMEFSGRMANLTVANLAMAVLRVDHIFEGMTFNIRSYEKGTDPEILLGNVPPGRALASIHLPKSLRGRIPPNGLQTILFNFFGQTSLFQIKNVSKTLTTYVVSASVSDTYIQNLADPVIITLQHIEGKPKHDQVQCAFWDFGSNNGQGGWNSSGCKVEETNVNYTICHCNHLTHFGVLMDFSRSAVDAVNERILTLITYTGCGISSIFLGVVMVTYIAFRKLRKDHPSKILINLCTALLMLNLMFLVNSWLSSFQKVELCITVAVVLHYFLLASLTWMGLEAVHMYFALVKVFNIYIPNYILKFCLAGWGIPAIVVAIILGVNKDLYGTLSPATPFCWIKDNSAFYLSVVAYFCLIFLVNISMFCTVLVQLNSIKAQSHRKRQKMMLHDFKGIMSLTFLLGLTWGFAFFAWGPVRNIFLYFFAVFNTLQGFLIFVFHCVMKESVREQWQIHLCCGWLRLDNSSDGGSRCGLNDGFKQERLKKTFEHKLLAPSLKSTATSSTFKSLGSAQGSPSEISFPNGCFDEDPYCFSPLSCEVVPNYLSFVNQKGNPQVCSGLSRSGQETPNRCQLQNSEVKRELAQENFARSTLCFHGYQKVSETVKSKSWGHRPLFTEEERPWALHSRYEENEG